MTASEARDLIRHCIPNGQVVPSPKFRKELNELALTMVDVWQILRTGHIYQRPEQDPDTGEWDYRIEGHEHENGAVGITFCFKAIEYAWLISIKAIE